MSSHDNRLKNLNNFYKLNINPYPSQQYNISHYTYDIINNYRKFNKNDIVSLAGRIMSKRIMGKVIFIKLKDSKECIQLYINKYNISNNNVTYDIIIKKLLDIGDIIGVRGHVFITKTNEISIKVLNIEILSKSIKDLPIVKYDKEGNKYDEFKNFELRYRNRHVDLIVNNDIKKIFFIRSKIITIIRNFLNRNEWLEVETPVLQNIYGGANANPFKTYYKALDRNLYLRISNELYLKRLIIGGFEGVYEISKMFRNEGMDSTHNPEFTSLELYVAYKDYIWMMGLVESLLYNIVTILYNKTNIIFNNQNIEFKGPYLRMTFFEAIRKYCKIDINSLNEQEIINFCLKNQIYIKPYYSITNTISAIFDKKVQPFLINPTFIIDYPVDSTPLAKEHRNNNMLLERFELFIGGKEIANAYSEENNPITQKKKLMHQILLSNNKSDDLDEDFISALSYGMPPTAGLGIGIDRLIMIFTNQKSIQEVLLFPHMRNVIK